MMSNFEDRLFADLMRKHGPTLAATPAPVTRRRMSHSVGYTLSAAGAAIAVAVAIAITVVGGSSAAAYAVTQTPAGTVTVSIRDISGVAGANRQLHRLGVRAVAVPITPGCPNAASLRRDSKSVGARAQRTESDDVAGSFIFDANAVPSGDTLVLAAQLLPSGVIRMTGLLVKGVGPTCLSLPDLRMP